MRRIKVFLLIAFLATAFNMVVKGSNGIEKSKESNKQNYPFEDYKNWRKLADHAQMIREPAGDG
jgi:hypothetical protein